MTIDFARIKVNQWLTVNKQDFEQFQQAKPEQYAALNSLATYLLSGSAENSPKPKNGKKSQAGRPKTIGVTRQSIVEALDAFVLLSKNNSIRKAFGPKRNAMMKRLSANEKRITWLTKRVGGKEELIRLHDGGAIAGALLYQAIEDLLYEEMSPKMRQLHDLTRNFFAQLSGHD